MACKLIGAPILEADPGAVAPYGPGLSWADV